MALSVADAKKIREGKSVNVVTRMISRVDAAGHVENFLGGTPDHSTICVRDRDSQNTLGTMGCMLGDGRIVQPDHGAGVLRTVNVTEVAYCEDEG